MIHQTIEYIWIVNNEIKKIIVPFREPKYCIEDVPIVNDLKPCALFNDPFHPSFEQTHKLVICNIDTTEDSGLYEILQTYYILDSKRRPLHETSETFILLHEFTQASLYSGLNIVYNRYKGDYKWEIKLGVDTKNALIQHTWIMRYIFIKYANSMGYFLRFEELEDVHDVNTMMENLNIV
jgi:hypothetical protein